MTTEDGRFDAALDALADSNWATDWIAAHNGTILELIVDGMGVAHPGGEKRAANALWRFYQLFRDDQEQAARALTE